MAIPVLIPRATITLEEANVICWRKQEGDDVRKDETLLEMETDKVVVEVPSPADGVLLRIDVKEGKAKVNSSVAWIGLAGEKLPKSGASPDLVQPVIVPPGQPDTSITSPAAGLIAASPAARRRARELGLDLSRVEGTGPGGRITEADVERVERGQ